MCSTTRLVSVSTDPRSVTKERRKSTRTVVIAFLSSPAVNSRIGSILFRVTRGLFLQLQVERRRAMPSEKTPIVFSFVSPARYNQQFSLTTIYFNCTFFYFWFIFYLGTIFFPLICSFGCFCFHVLILYWLSLFSMYQRVLNKIYKKIIL